MKCRKGFNSCLRQYEKSYCCSRCGCCYLFSIRCSASLAMVSYRSIVHKVQNHYECSTFAPHNKWRYFVVILYADCLPSGAGDAIGYTSCHTVGLFDVHAVDKSGTAIDGQRAAIGQYSLQSCCSIDNRPIQLCTCTQHTKRQNGT